MLCINIKGIFTNVSGEVYTKGFEYTQDQLNRIKTFTYKKQGSETFYLIEINYVEDTVSNPNIIVNGTASRNL